MNWRADMRPWVERAGLTVLAACVLVSLALSLYVMCVSHVWLPSGDVIRMHEFLSRAAVGDIDWLVLWERHNGLHRIVLPKLVLAMDMALTHGSGWLTIVVAAVLVCATAALFAARVLALAALPLSLRRWLAGLAVLLLGSVLVAESYRNPINIQWAWLAFGAVLLAGGLQALRQQQGGWVQLWAGIACCSLSAGPLSLLLVAAVLAWLLVGPQAQRVRRWLGRGLLVWLLVFLAWEITVAVRGRWQDSLLVWLYWPFMTEADWLRMRAFFAGQPGFQIGWVWQRMMFFGSFLLRPLTPQELPAEWLLLPLLGWFVLLRRLPQVGADRLFFLYLCLFSALLGMAASVPQYFMPVYTFRHANMGLLLGLSSMVLCCSACAQRLPQGLLKAVLLLYALWFVTAAASGAAQWARFGRDTLGYQQTALAVGVRDPQLLGLVWQPEPDQHAALAYWQQLRLGVYASPEYRRFAGELALPSLVIACRYRLLASGRHAGDPRAVWLRGETLAGDGRAMTQVQLRTPAGVAVGYGTTVLPAETLAGQWQQPWQWSAHAMPAGDVPQVLDVIAHDGERRCQPWRVPIPPP